jgi:hypothetical protein
LETNRSKGKEETEMKETEGMKEETEDRVMGNLTDLIKDKTMASEEATITTDQATSPINPTTTTKKEEKETTTTITLIGKRISDVEVKRKLILGSREATKNQ